MFFIGISTESLLESRLGESYKVNWSIWRHFALINHKEFCCYCFHLW